MANPDNEEYICFRHPGTPDFYQDTGRDNLLGQNTTSSRLVASTRIPVDQPGRFVDLLKRESEKNKPVYLRFQGDDGEALQVPVVAQVWY